VPAPIVLNEPPLLDLESVAALLGISIDTVEAMVARDQIPIVRVGSRLRRVRRRDLDGFLGPYQPPVASTTSQPLTRAQVDALVAEQARIAEERRRASWEVEAERRMAETPSLTEGREAPSPRDAIRLRAGLPTEDAERQQRERARAREDARAREKANASRGA